MRVRSGAFYVFTQKLGGCRCECSSLDALQVVRVPRVLSWIWIHSQRMEIDSTHVSPRLWYSLRSDIVVIIRNLRQMLSLRGAPFSAGVDIVCYPPGVSCNPVLWYDGNVIVTLSAFVSPQFADWCMNYGKHGCRTPDTPFSLFEGNIQWHVPLLHFHQIWPPPLPRWTHTRHICSAIVFQYWGLRVR